MYNIECDISDLDCVLGAPILFPHSPYLLVRNRKEKNSGWVNGLKTIPSLTLVLTLRSEGTLGIKDAILEPPVLFACALVCALLSVLLMTQ